MDKLIEKGAATPQLAQAIGEALDITLKTANLVTVPVLDARLAQYEAKMESRFGDVEARFGTMEARFNSLERAFANTKVWAVLLYAGLVTLSFGALAMEHRWLVNREDQFMAQLQARTDARFDAEEAHTDKLFAEDHALIAKQQARAEEAETRLAAKLDNLQSLLLAHSRR